MPKVSIIIPSFNRAEFLYSAITSVVNQTFQDFEIIVIDDASEDNTREVVDCFHDTRIKYLHHETNRGEACARNIGIANSNGQYIAFLDDDDEWLPEKLRLQVELLEHSVTKIGLVYSGYLGVDKAKNCILFRRIPRARGYVYNLICTENLVGAPSTVLIKRECIDKIGFFDEGIAYGLDHDLWIRIAEHYHFDFIEECLVKYHIHENRLTNNPGIMAKGLEDMIMKYGKHIVFKNRYYRKGYLTIGVKFCEKGDMNNGRKAFLNAIRVDPLEIRSYFNLVCSFFGAKNYKKIKHFKDKLLAHLR